jgi:hypothetical protein
MLARIIAGLGYLFLIWLTIAVYNHLSADGYGDRTGYLILSMVGAAVAWTGVVVVACTAFDESTVSGLCCYFVPFYFVIYGVKKCPSGVGIWFVGFVGSWGVQAIIPRDQGPSRVAQRPSFEPPPVMPRADPPARSAPLSPNPFSRRHAPRPGSPADPSMSGKAPEESLHDLQSEPRAVDSTATASKPGVASDEVMEPA